MMLYCIVLYCKNASAWFVSTLYTPELFAYFITYTYQQDGGYSRAHVKIITQINSIFKNIIEITLNNF